VIREDAPFAAYSVTHRHFFTFTATGFDAMPSAMTTSVLPPVSVAADTVKLTELDAPGSIDLVLGLVVRA
jgi:hypothetical protein